MSPARAGHALCAIVTMPLNGLKKISRGFTREDQNPSLEPSRRAISQRREKNLVFLLFHAEDGPRLEAEALANLLRNHDPSEAIYGDLHACPSVASYHGKSQIVLP